MSIFQFLNRGLAQRFAALLLAGMLWLTAGLIPSAQAADSSTAKRYIAADGTDLTAMVQCLPTELSEGNFGRALEQSKNDFLEKVFDVKDDYSDYKLDDAEIEYLACLKGKGVISQVMQ